MSLLNAGAVTRRRAIQQGSLGAALLLGTGAVSSDRASATTRISGNAFSLGVASGDPLPRGVVLWTRLAPDPTAPDGLGGMPPERVRVRYELSRNENFRGRLRRGRLVASPELAHSIHAEVSGLRPETEYFYRFEAGGQISPIGRTKTAPRPDARLDALRLAFVSCQSWEAGFYTAYRHLAAEAVDAIMHLGDYLYEYPVPGTGGARNVPVGPQYGVETTTLETYRLRYGLYKSDPDLQAAHASAPFIVTWDDHEVDNNYAGEIPEKDIDAATFPARRGAAYRTFYEHLPLRRTVFERASEMKIYRSLDYGEMARIHVLDGRQYRSDQACGDGRRVPCAAALDPSRTMLGGEQEKWLLRSLGESRSRWNIIANQTLMTAADADPGPGVSLSMDNWNGYTPARQRLLDGVAERDIRNMVVVTGDSHCSIAADLKLDFDDPNSTTVGAEFLGTSITSGGDGADFDARGQTFLASNPNMKFYNGQRGYCTMDLTRKQLTNDYKVLPYVTAPGAPIATRARFTVKHGEPGIQEDAVAPR